MVEINTVKKSVADKITAWSAMNEVGGTGSGHEVITSLTTANAVHTVTMRILKSELENAVAEDILYGVGINVAWGPIEAAWKPKNLVLKTIKQVIGSVVNHYNRSGDVTDAAGGFINGSVSRVRMIGVGSMPISANLKIKWNIYVHRASNYMTLLAESEGKVSGRGVRGTVMLANKIDKDGRLMGTINPIFTKKFSSGSVADDQDEYEEEATYE